jgi:hypothetical protein
MAACPVQHVPLSCEVKYMSRLCSNSEPWNLWYILVIKLTDENMCAMQLLVLIQAFEEHGMIQLMSVGGHVVTFGCYDFVLQRVFAVRSTVFVCGIQVCGMLTRACGRTASGGVDYAAV